MQMFTLLSAYQSHEHDLRKILSFITPDIKHDGVYSPQIAKHLVSSGVAFEGVCKEIGRVIEITPGDIGAYKAMMLSNFPKIWQFEVMISIENRVLKPLHGWSSANLDWWTAYTNLKHDYFGNIADAQLVHALNATGAYLIAILYFGYLEHHKKNPHVPDALAPSLLIPKDYSSSSGFDGGGIFHEFPLII
jgi:hypothetical protein